MIGSYDRAAIALVGLLVFAGVTEADEPAARQVEGWGKVIDPSRDCKVNLDPSRGRLTISVPGTSHILSTEIEGMPLSAPRVVQSTLGDFKATVRVAGKLEPKASKTTHYDPYHGAGLLVWKDERNYLRLERAVASIRGHATPYLNYELRRDGRLAFSRGIPIEDHPIHLKIERAVGEIRAFHSSDGSRWSELPGLDAPMPGRVDVGVVAINSSRNPLRAELEQFEIELASGSQSSKVSQAGSSSKPADLAGDRRGAK